MEVGDVTEAHERLGFRRHQVVVDQRQHLDRTCATPETEDDIDIVVFKKRVQVVDSILRRTCYVVVA